MPKAPEKPSEIFGLFIDDCKKIFGDDLLSIILYGSGAKGDYQRKKSDINFLVVLSEESIDDLKGVVPFVQKWRKHAIAIPIFMRADYIQSSLDSYPMEFLDMKLRHQLVYGKDYLENLEIKDSDLRVQCEREIKGNLLHLRQNLISSGLKPKIMGRILIRTLPAFEAIMEALIHLKREPVPDRAKQIFEKGAELFNLDGNVFADILSIKSGQKKSHKDELVSLFERHISTIKNLSIEVDKM
ncbi:MAG: nucleotidyltransferase domain-containing protein [bacterium]